MGYKKYRTHIDDHGNKLTKEQVIQAKADYAKEHQYCECCGGGFCLHYGLAIHHHIRQQYKYHGNEYVLEFTDNYSMIGMDCHSIIEHNEKQYNREIFLENKIPYIYFHELKNGQEPSFYVREYIRLLPQ